MVQFSLDLLCLTFCFCVYAQFEFDAFPASSPCFYIIRNIIFSTSRDREDPGGPKRQVLAPRAAPWMQLHHSCLDVMHYFDSRIAQNTLDSNKGFDALH